jgi:imidazolonepropionase-like amidohydrolase
MIEPLSLMNRLLLSLALTSLALPARAQLAVRGDTVYTMAGAPIPDGVVLVENGRIRAVGPASRVSVPRGWQTVRGRIVTPGLIDARGTVGLSGLLNQRQDQDHLDATGPVQPELRALDAYNPLDSLVAWLRRFGVTTIHTGHSEGALAAGTMAVFKTAGTTADEAVVVPEAMIAMTVGEGISSVYPSPGTRAKSIAMLRSELLKARDYDRRRRTGAAPADPAARDTTGMPQPRTEDRLNESPSRPAAPPQGTGATETPTRDLKLEALAALLRGERTALVSAHRAHDIQAALRLQREFGFRMVLDGGAEAYLVLDDLKAAGVPVFVHPTMIRAGGAAQNASMDTAARLHAAGIPFAFTSGYEAYVPKTRVVLFEAGVAVGQGGLPRRAALEALTVGAARLLGLDGRLGTLAEGRDADLVVWDGDPLEYTTHACTVVIGGAVVSQTCR